MKTLNKRSCVLDSFAYILGLDPVWVSNQVGHRGRDGFHTQELIDVCLTQGFAVTAIERKPVGQNPVDGSMRLIEFPGGDPEHRFGWHMTRTKGVLCGRTPFKNKPHAVAWDDPYAIDPAVGLKYHILDAESVCDDINFKPMVYYMMEEIR